VYQIQRYINLPLVMAAFISNSALTADNERSRLNRPPDVDPGTSLQLQRAKFMNSCTLVCSLPVEVLSKIFELGQTIERDELQDVDDSDVDDASGRLAFEVSISHVSSHFRNVALGTRKLWIDITRIQSKESIAAYVSRSDGCGLWVQLDFSAKALANANERAKLDIILPHVYRFHRLIINTINEEIDNPVIRLFHETGAPILEHLSISVEEAEEAAGANTSVFVGGADQLSFVRLRGIAISLFQPPLSMVTTLHLDQTLPLPIHFSTFLHILTASPFLAHLSVYGDIVGPLAWSDTMSTIDLPNLRSLRIRGVSGTIYSNLLLNINAACLNSLVLKDAQEFDLENFWASPDMCKFPQLHHLTFCDFEFSSHVYADVFRAFPAIKRFTTWCSSATPMILTLLARPTEDLDIPWPDLHTLSFLLNFYDDDLIKDVVQNREAAGCPLVRLRLGTSHHPSALRQYHWLQNNVVLERTERLEQWPATDASPDKGDDLFY
jgi:hypothetical protein